jgi:hypothetical protein
MLLKNCALLTIIENNTDNKNSKMLNTERKYFDEAIKCFESWQKFHPEVKIYAVCPTNATLSKKEQKVLEKLNVEYIEKYFPETETFENGFINVALVIQDLEDKIKEKIIIHTDLDMVLLKSLPNKIFAPIFDEEIICGKYDENARKCQRVDYDTGFTIHLRNTRFYKVYWNKIKEILDNKIKLPEGVLYYDIEEYAMQLIAQEGKYKITPIQKYQLGEGYPSIDTFSDEELKDVYFWHEHIVGEKKEELIKERIKYFRRIQKV